MAFKETELISIYSYTVKWQVDHKGLVSNKN